MRTMTWTTQYKDTGDGFPWLVVGPDGDTEDACDNEREAVGLTAYYQAYDAAHDEDPDTAHEVATAIQGEAETEYDENLKAEMTDAITDRLDGLSIEQLRAVMDLLKITV